VPHCLSSPFAAALLAEDHDVDVLSEVGVVDDAVFERLKRWVLSSAQAQTQRTSNCSAGVNGLIPELERARQLEARAEEHIVRAFGGDPGFLDIIPDADPQPDTALPDPGPNAPPTPITHLDRMEP
jgi:hypothetical protein